MKLRCYLGPQLLSDITSIQGAGKEKFLNVMLILKYVNKRLWRHNLKKGKVKIK